MSYESVTQRYATEHLWPSVRSTKAENARIVRHAAALMGQFNVWIEMFVFNRISFEYLKYQAFPRCTALYD